ncbi:MAG: redoxin domain-containing protein [Armatimonadetes bacterium]|nr:redoxin domain-containing protein [Armatimonadota bacterium]
MTLISTMAIAASTLVGVAVVASQDPNMPTDTSDMKAQINHHAPDFTLKDMKGVDQSLGQYKGKWVVLEWNNKDCPIVQRHYNSGNMQELQDWAVKKGVVWLTICSSASGKQGYVDASGAMASTEDVKWKGTAYLLDPEGKVGKMYDAKTTPEMFVINPDGMLIYMGAIDDKPNAGTNEVKNSRNYVREALDLAMAGKPLKMKVSQPYGCNVKY